MMTLHRSTLAALFFLNLAAAAVSPRDAAAAPKTKAETAPRAAESSDYRADPRSIELNEQAVLAVNSRNFAEAEELFKQSLAADSKNATAAVNLAAMYLTNKKNAAAIALLEQYTAHYPKDAPLAARLGDAYFASKKVPEAIVAYEKALALDAHYPNAAARLGTLYALSRRLSDSERMFLQAAEEDPRNGQVLSSLSSILLANGKADKAVSTAKRGLQVNPTKELYITLGSAYEALKDPKNSLIAFERARDLGDKSPELEAKIAALEKTTDSVS